MFVLFFISEPYPAQGASLKSPSSPDYLPNRRIHFLFFSSSALANETAGEEAPIIFTCPRGEKKTWMCQVRDTLFGIAAFLEHLKIRQVVSTRALTATGKKKKKK